MPSFDCVFKPIKEEMKMGKFSTVDCFDVFVTRVDDDEIDFRLGHERTNTTWVLGKEGARELSAFFDRVANALED